MNESRVFGGSESSFVDSGFVTLQSFVDNAIVNINRQAVGVPPVVVDMTYSQLEIPRPSLVGPLIPVYLGMSFMQVLQVVLFILVTERQDKIKQGMIVMGLREPAYWVSFCGVQTVTNLLTWGLVAVITVNSTMSLKPCILHTNEILGLISII